ncbi:zinc metalloprotease family m13 neprilysin-related [Holotrichia oblita]|uniref:Zinc metalloprotease family m13 neprilysin-related n=1 Tax=Holotrichia oblita TaxID=644536 RepID=A0ACB9T682_HOLOL|nr:zinc metalloprotease family m13 neprilysin-related [Holotrichia oblita]
MEINSVVENTWKFNNKDLNNGFLKNDSKIQESVDSLLTNSTPVATMVQVSGSGTQTVVHHPRKSRSSRERLLLGVVFILIMVSSISLVMLINASAKCNKNASSLLSAMDHASDPCVDFFQYACGTWNKKNIIPEDRSSISTFEVMADQLQIILKGVLEEPINSNDNEATIKAKTFYNTCIDIAFRPPPLPLPPQPLRKSQSTRFFSQLDQTQLALPSRDYYLKSSSEGDMQAYHKYMTHVAVLLGANKTTAAEELRLVVEFERKLANASLPEADRHDTSAIYRKLTLAELQKIVPQIKWLEYLTSFLNADITEREPVVAYGLSYFIEMGKILAETDRRVIHNYVLWRLIMALVPHMIDDYQRERVEFRKILLGILSERHRWSQCVEWTNKKLGMAVGALFIRDNFNHDSKETALSMIHTIREAFNELLTENHWMDDETRAVAKEKADAMNERIGYPQLITNSTELIKEYASLNITQDEFMTNILNVLKYDADQNLQKLRQPVDKDKWSTEPAVVNAFYNPNKNDIGRQFDKDGNMMQWWNNATIKAFRERAQCIIDQYSRYKIDEVGLYVNGRMTQGENIADNGGLKQSFRAYRKWVSQHGEEADLPGLNLSHDQLFFLNYAQIWCGSMRPEDALTKIRSSVHSPGPIRVLGPLSNSKDFAKAYNCPLGSPMNPTSKCNVW